MQVTALLLACMTASVAAKDMCKMDTGAYPPNATRALPWHTIDLDAAPEDRWTAVVTPLSAQILAMIDQLVDRIPPTLRNEILANLTRNAPGYVDAMPPVYAAEIRAIAAATDIDLGLIFLYNIAYELEGACTSIVAQNSNGDVFHARNLDFGLFDGWDNGTNTWALAEKLRPLLFNARFIKGGVTFYNATVYAGYVGLLTGMRTGNFSITVDTRFDLNIDSGLISWLKGNHSGHFLSFTTRNVMENNFTFADALETLNNTKMIGPSYIILGGINPGEGAVITREQALSLHLMTLSAALQNNTHFILETNYDHWVPAPFFDDRRTPATDCMKKIGPQGTSLPALFDVLSGRPNLNEMTTYTTLMHVATGQFEAYVQNCPWPCPPW